MIKVKILCVGKTNEEYLKIGIDKYTKRLRYYCDFSIECVKEANYTTKNKNLQVEGKRLLVKIPGNSYNILLDDKGKQTSSQGLADSIEKWTGQGKSNLYFIIGGAFGVSREITEASNIKLSISSMTFTHQMVRLLVIEQIYRAFTIIKNEKYHHA